jgi:hypothetical protein
LDSQFILLKKDAGNYQSIPYRPHYGSEQCQYPGTGDLISQNKMSLKRLKHCKTVPSPAPTMALASVSTGKKKYGCDQAHTL